MRAALALGRRPPPVAGSLDSPALLRAYPGLRAARDAGGMRERLQAALVGPRAGGGSVARCAVAQAICDPPGTCLVRYEIELGGPAPGAPAHLVTVRFFPTAAAADRYLRERLRPLAERVGGRPELRALATPAAVLPDIRATAAVFPVDPDLPTLVDATDDARVTRALAREAPVPLAVARCDVSRGHYGRRHRCVLRYELDGDGAGSGSGRRTLYGKVAADDRGARALRVMAALRAMPRVEGGHAPAIPEPLLYSPAMRLLVLEELPGAPVVGRLLRMRIRREPAREPGALGLEQAVEACAHAAAYLHASPVEPGPPRTAAGELAELAAGVDAMRPVAPELASWLEARLGTVEDRLAGSSRLAHRLSHGDFTSTQLLADGRACGLVDFDTVCHAEPALDLGQFTAHLRVACRKAERRAGASRAELADRLCERFLDVYARSTPGGPPAARRLLRRARAYELVSLLRLAIHSWQKAKTDRLGDALEVIEERRR